MLRPTLRDGPAQAPLLIASMIPGPPPLITEKPEFHRRSAMSAASRICLQTAGAGTRGRFNCELRLFMADFRHCDLSGERRRRRGSAFTVVSGGTYTSCTALTETLFWNKTVEPHVQAAKAPGIS